MAGRRETGDGVFRYEEDDWRLRPHWLHPDCVDPCAALDLGTCCKYPAATLVERAVELADTTSAALRRIRDHERTESSAELARLFSSVPALLAQVHAVLPSLTTTVAAQLLCPIGRLSGSLDLPGRRAEFESVRPLLEECATALVTVLTDYPPSPG